MKSKDIENRTVGLNVKPLEPRRIIGNKRLYQYGALFVAIIMVFSSVGYATIKLGEDGSGQKWFGDDAGLITSSNGKAYPATGAGLQAAIWGLNGTGGIVNVPQGEYTIDFDINLTNVILRGVGSGCSWAFGSDVDCLATQFALDDTANITIHLGGKLQGIYINVSNNYDGEAIVVEGERFWISEKDVLKDITLRKGSCANGTGITIRARHDNQHYIMFTSFEDIYVWGFYNGMVTENDGSGAYASGNIYSDLSFHANARALTTYDSGGVYSNIQISADTGTIEGIRSHGAGIMFSNVMCWDWQHASGLCLNISGGKCYAEGYFCDKINCTGVDNVIIDNSIGTIFGNSETTSTFTVSSNTSEDSSLADYVCDGVADQDTIELAIAALPAGGGHIILKEGTYYFDGQFNISQKDNWILQGQGNNTILLLSTNIDPDKMVYIVSNNFVMRDLQVNANGKTCDRVITVTGDSVRCRIDNCYITAGQDDEYGIYFYHPDSSECVIENCNIWDCDYAIYANTNNVSIINNRIHGNSHAAIAFGDYHRIRGNDLYDNEYGIFNVNNSRITDNIIYDNSISGITTQSPRKNVVKDNMGWITENSGTDTITTTSKTVAHGLDGAPTVINICWRENPTDSVGDWWVDTIGGTNFVLNVATDPGANDLDFGWEAKVR